MHNNVIKIFNVFLSLTLVAVFFNLLVSTNIFYSRDNIFITRAQEINTTTKSDGLTFGANHTALSLIPLMIKEMENTNATTIPIKQVINATPSNVTALQNMAKSNILNNISNNFILNAPSRSNALNTIPIKQVINATPSNVTALQNLSKISPANKTDLIPFVVNLTKNTNATHIAIAETINATPSNVTALQNLSKNNTLNSIRSAHNSISKILNNITTSRSNALNTTNLNKINNFSPVNKTDLIPFVVNLTKNANATHIAIAKTINTTPSNITALQNMAKSNILNNISNAMNLSR